MAFAPDRRAADPSERSFWRLAICSTAACAVPRPPPFRGVLCRPAFVHSAKMKIRRNAKWSITNHRLLQSLRDLRQDSALDVNRAHELADRRQHQPVTDRR